MLGAGGGVAQGSTGPVQRAPEESMLGEKDPNVGKLEPRMGW